MRHRWPAAVLAVAVWGWLTPASAQNGDPRADLPMAHANNAVAQLERDGQTYFYSFLGLKSGKTWRDTSRMAFEYHVDADRWRRLPDVPVDRGRLAGAAVGLGGVVYLFGGYTVAESGAEVSTPEVFAFDPAADRYARRADMPTPVDDSMALAYADRYIYLISGWHADGNVTLVQVYDTAQDRWFRATDYPGLPVFGHAGGIVGNRMVVADGVAVLGFDNGRRRFGIVDEAWAGEIDGGDPAVIRWTRLPPHPGAPLYRMAAAGSPSRNQVLFAGGSDNAYNYNGIGYDGTPSKPSAHGFAWDFASSTWVALPPRAMATMDHRGLLAHDGAFYTLGGMVSDQQVTATVVVYRPESKRDIQR